MAIVLTTAAPVFTVLMMIDRAYSLLGFKAAGEPLNAEDAEYGRNALNSMLDGWNTQAMSIVSVSSVAGFVSGVSAAIGPGMEFDTARPVRIERGSFVRVDGQDFPLHPIDHQTYAAIPDKTVPAGVPEFVYYEPNMPTATVFFYPPAAAGTQVYLALQVPLLEFPDMTAAVSLARGYRKAIEYSLAEELAPGIKEVPMTVTRTAANARRAIRRTNVRVPLLDTGIVNTRFNGYIGQ